jgi:DNA-binding NarL/FixJ family response regulator
MKLELIHRPKIRVGIFDEDPLRLIGFRDALGSERDLELTLAGNMELGERVDIDVAILRERRGCSLACQLEKITAALPRTRVLATGSSLDQNDVIESIGLGAKGYIRETASAAEFANAIRTVNQGLIWAPRRLLAIVIDRIIDSFPGAHSMDRAALTSREKEVLQILVTGSSNKEIAGPLGIEVRTVKAHVSHLMQKLGVKNRLAAAVEAVRQSMVSV